MQIDFTWNLFTTPLVVALSTFFLARYMNKKDKDREEREHKREAERAEERQKLSEALAEKEKMKQEELTAWRNRYEQNICTIKEGIKSVTHIAKDIDHNKVEVEDCEKRSTQQWHMIGHHQHDERGKVVIE